MAAVEVFNINTIMDFPDYYKRICGYIRISALSEEDYRVIIEKFIKHDLKLNNSSKDINRLLYYKADVFMLKYYSEFKYSERGQKKEKIKQKVRYLFDRIQSIYPEAYKDEDIKGYFMPFEIPSHFKLKKFFKCLSDSGYPHQVLSFCYRSLLEKWEVDRVVMELSQSSLDEIYDKFVNLYSRQTDIPVFLVNLYLLGLKEKLGKRLKNIIVKNDGVTPVRMEKYLNWVTGWTLLEFYYGKGCSHDVSDWCNKVKVKALREIITELNY